MPSRRGIAIGVVFVILVVLFLGGLAIMHLMRGVQRQLEFSDAHLRTQYIGEAGMNLLMSRLLAQPWEKRWFAAGPKAEADLSYGGGAWDYFIQDTPGRFFHADLWIRASFKTTRRCFFWRIKYDHGLLGGLAMGMPVTRVELEPDEAPAPGTTVTTPFTDRIEQILTERSQKKKKAEEVANGVRKVVPTDRVMSNLGLAPVESAPKAPFPVNVQAAVPTTVVAVPLTVTFPVLPPFPPIFTPKGKDFEKPFKDWLKKNIPDPDEHSAKLGKFEKGFAEYSAALADRKFPEAMAKLTAALKAINKNFDQEESDLEQGDVSGFDLGDLWDFFDRPGNGVGWGRGDRDRDDDRDDDRDGDRDEGRDGDRDEGRDGGPGGGGPGGGGPGGGGPGKGG